MPDIIPVSELRQDATNVIKRTSATGNPVFVTQHGRASAVVMSANLYEKTLNELGILKVLLRGEQEIQTGKGFDLDEVTVRLDSILDES